MANPALRSSSFGTFLCSEGLAQNGNLERSLQESHCWYQELVFDHGSRALFLSALVFIIIVCGTLLDLLVEKCLRRKDFVDVEGRIGHFFFLLYCYLISLWMVGYVLQHLMPDSEIREYLSYWLINGIFCLCIGLDGLWLKRESSIALGMRPIFLRELIVGCAGYLMFVPFFLGSYFVTHILFACFGTLPHAQDVAEKLLHAEGIVLWVGIATAVIAAPVFEEFIFRVFLYSNLRKFMGVSPALVLSSLVFSISHAEPFVFYPIFMLGAFLALIYEKTQCLYAPILIHALHNGVTLLYLSFTLD